MIIIVINFLYNGLTIIGKHLDASGFLYPKYNAVKMMFNFDAKLTTQLLQLGNSHYVFSCSCCNETHH